MNKKLCSLIGLAAATLLCATAGTKTNWVNPGPESYGKYGTRTIGLLRMEVVSDGITNVPSTNITYTVKTPVWETTNAVAILPDHEHATPPCTLILFVENGRTNEFHAWCVPIVITTNTPAK